MAIGGARPALPLAPFLTRRWIRRNCGFRTVRWTKILRFVCRAGGATHTRREHPNGSFGPSINVSFLVIYCQQAKDGLDQKWQPVEDGGAEREVVRRHSPAEPSARDVDLNGWIRG